MSVSAAIAYALFCFSSAAILIHILLTLRKYGKPSLGMDFLRRSVFCCTVCAMVAPLIAMRESNITHFGTAINYAIQIIYLLASIYAGYMWFFSSECSQRAACVSTKKKRYILAIPCAVLSVLTITTPFTHISFKLEGNLLTYGTHYLPANIVMILMIIISGIGAAFRSFRKEYYTERHFLRTLSLYALFLAISEGLELAFGEIAPFRVLSGVAVFYIMESSVLKENISVDPLSRVNNRGEMERYIAHHLPAAHHSFCMILFDLDNFKSINDVYGHAVGDDAIRLMADSMRRAVPRDFFIARYGGDEFVAIGDAPDASLPSDIIKKVRGTLFTLAVDRSLPFTPDFSAGYAFKETGMTDVPDLLNVADKYLYAEKERKKAAMGGKQA